ncbi:hypothetical protein TPR58_03270 [Sphingomonas sp. HF-S3]|uniref:Suppressor of fused protein (SUFU) n=1 Tax=Sphingomonas rustica TaxID=3103142 RepID=A0ABV0B5M8_9SPHN
MSPREAAPAPSAAAQASGTDALDASFAARSRFWSRVGTVESDVLTHLISPQFTGGPAWPTTRQAYRIVRRADGTLVLATDGLSDPFDDGGDTNGYGMEIFVQCADLPPEQAGTPGEITALRDGWMFALLSHIAGIVATNEGIVPMLDRYDGLLSMELPGVSQSHPIASQVPSRFVTADDALGVLIGGPAPDFPTMINDMPVSPVRMVPIVLLTAGELGEVRAGDQTTRVTLAEALAKQPYTHLKRDSLV